MRASVPHILLAEDSAEDARLIRDVLAEIFDNPQIDLAADMAACRAMLASASHDVLLLSQKMASVGITESLTELQTSWPELAIIILNRDADDYTCMLLIEHGAQDCLDKQHLDPPLLGKAIRLALSRKRAESRLAVREWEATSNAIAEGLCIIDRHGNIIRCNKAAESFIGLPGSRLIGRQCKQLFLGKNSNLDDCPIDRAMLSKKSERSTINIGEKWLEITVSPILATDGTVEKALHHVRDITESHSLQAKASQTGELFQQLMRYTPVYTFIKEVTHDESRVIIASENFEDMVGVPGSQMAGKTMRELFPPDFADRITHDDWSVCSEGMVLQQDEELNDRYYTTVKLPIFSGSKHLLAGFTLDITHRRQLEMERERLLSMLEAIGDEIHVFEQDTMRFVYVNRSACNKLGYSLEQMLQMTPLDIKAVGSRKEFESRTMPLVSGQQQLVTFDTRHVRADGSSYPVEVRLQFVQSPDSSNGKGRLFMAVLHDISERVEARKRLQHLQLQSERFRTALDQVPSYIYMKDRDSRYTFANQGTLKLFGCPDEELVGSCDDRFFPPETVKLLREIDLRVLAGQQNQEEITVDYADGRQTVYWEVKTPLHASTDDDTIIGLLGISSDITAVKESEKAVLRLQTQLMESEKLASIGQLAAGVSHEINNPLGYIYSDLSTLERYAEKYNQYISLLEQGIQNLSGAMPEEIEEVRQRLKIDYVRTDTEALIRECCDGVERIKTIVTDLKTFARNDLDQLSETDMNQLLDNTLSLLRNEIKYVANVKCEYGVLPAIICNGQRIQQVFINLLINAAHSIADKKMDEPGQITIRTWQDGKNIFVRIADSGCGIPADVQPRIFEPFFTTKDVGKGTGMGLSVSLEIVRRYGGEIQMESTPGQGSSFTVRLPVHQDLD